MMLKHNESVMNLLLVDDNKSITNMLSEYLTMKKHNCVVTNDGKNAVNIIQNSSFDVIFLDLAMPDFNGYDVIQTLEQRNLLDKQKIIILTASDISEDKEEMLYSKNIKILKKPVQIQELLQFLTKN